MAITLQTIAAPGATPIGKRTASQIAFDNSYYKLAAGTVAAQDRKAVMILAMVYILALTGANYKANHAGLIQDAAVYTGGISNFDIFAAFAATSASAANTADGAFSLDLPTLLKEARDIVDLPEQTQDRLIGFLAAQLGL